MAIVFFGHGTNPADGGSLIEPQTGQAITPPATMLAGDLVIIFLYNENGSAGDGLALDGLGGQSWTSDTTNGSYSYSGTAAGHRIYWCRFNGTWTANPTFTLPDKTGNRGGGGQMLVFRPDSTSYAWAVDTAPAWAGFSAPTSPFTVTITGITPSNSNTVTIARWCSDDDNTWNSLSGSGWNKTGLTAQYRNTGGSDLSTTFAYNIKGAPSATGNVSQNQATLGGDAGSTVIISFYEYLASPSITPSTGSLTTSGNAPNVVRGTIITPSTGSLTTSGNAPQLVGGTVITPSVGSLTTSGNAPSIISGTVIEPPAGSLTTSGNAPTIVSGTIITPTTGSLTTSGNAPSVVRETFITPAVGSLTLSGQLAVPVQVVQRYLNTASAGGDGTTNATYGASAAYASMSSAEANMGGSATDSYILDCCGAAADTTKVTWDFPTNLTTGTLLVRGNRGHANGFYNGNQVISTAHYRLDCASSAASVLSINEHNVTINGIQIVGNGDSFSSGVLKTGSFNNFVIEKCRLYAAASMPAGVNVSGDSNITITIRNNLIVNWNTQGINSGTALNATGVTVNIYNNTIYGDGSSIGINIQSSGASAAVTYNVKGNALANSGVSNDIVSSLTGSSVANYNDNATSDFDLGTTGEINLNGETNAWTSPGTASTSDFTVKDTSSSLYNSLNPTLLTDDIRDLVRTGTNHDVGAFEFGYGITPSRGDLTIQKGINLLIRSEEFDNSNWVNVNSNEGVNFAAAPDGTNTAEKLVDSGSGPGDTTHYIYQAVTGLSNNTVYSFSAYLKASDRTWGALLIAKKDGSNGYRYVNLSTGTLGTSSGISGSSISDEGNGWYRVTISADILSGATTPSFVVYIAEADNDVWYVGNTTGIYVWGAQLESGSTSGNYQKTTSAAFTLEVGKPIVVRGTVITPSTGTLTITGNVPSVFANIAETPTTGSLATSGNAPVVIRGENIAPPVGSITTSGNSPIVVLGTIITPTVGSLTIEGNAPGVVRGDAIAPSVGSLTTSGNAPTIITGTIITPAVGSVSISGNTPNVVRGDVITPAVGSITISGYAPTIISGTVITPTSGALSVAGNAPLPVIGSVITPTVGPLSTSGNQPEIIRGSVITASAGSVSLSGEAPAVVRGTVITPSVGSIAISGNAPVVVGGTVITPSVGTLTTAGYAPSVEISSGITITPDTGTLTTSGNAPSVVLGTIITPSTGSLSLTGEAPIVLTGQGAIPSSGNLVISGETPVVVSGTIVTPSVGSLAIGGQTPIVSVGTIITPSIGTITTTGFTPDVTRGSVITPNTGSLALSGAGPTLDYAISAPVGTVTLTGNAPSVVLGTIITPGEGSVTLSGQTATITQSTTITPSTGSLTASGNVPDVIRGVVTTPDAGTLTTTGLAPTFDFGIVPSVGSLTLEGYAPLTGSGTLVQVPSGSLSVSTENPIVVMGMIIIPDTGSVATSGQTPDLIRGAVITPPAGSLALSGNAPNVSIGSTIAPDIGTLVLSSEQPVVNETNNHVITIPTGQLVITGYVPASSGAITPDTGSLILSGEVPVVQESSNTVITPSTGSLQISGNTSDLLTNHISRPSLAGLTVPGQAPLAVVDNRITVDVGSMAISGNVPVLARGPTIIPTVGALSVTGQTPDIVITESITITPNSAALSITGNLAVVSQPSVVLEEPGGIWRVRPEKTEWAVRKQKNIWRVPVRS